MSQREELGGKGEQMSAGGDSRTIGGATTEPVCEAGAMWIDWIEFDLLLGDVHSLKEKRAVLRPVIAELRRATEASVAEVGDQELHRRAAIGVGVVAAGADRVTEVLDLAERLVAARPEITLLSAGRRLRRSDDE